MIIDETELNLLTEAFEKRYGKLGESHFTHYTRYNVSCFKETIKYF